MAEEVRPIRDRKTTSQKRSHGTRAIELANRLLAMQSAVVDKLQLDDNVRAEHDFARTIDSHGARKRQDRRLAQLIRGTDMDALEEQLNALDDVNREQSQRFQQSEKWRRRFLDEGTSALASFLEKYPSADVAAVTLAVKNALKEKDTGFPRGAAKALFRILHEIIAA